MNLPIHYPEGESLGLPPIPNREIVDKINALRGYDFIVAPRDPNINYHYHGLYMVCEHYEPGHRQPHGRRADDPSVDPIWCVVGDDITILVNEAVRHFELEGMA